MQTITPADVLRAARERSASLVVLLEDLVRAESPAEEPLLQEITADILDSALQSAGLVVDRVSRPGAGDHLLARRRNAPEGDPSQLLLGHYDTVWPAGTILSRPVIREGDVLRGPGAYDMKGGLAILLGALGMLNDLGLDPSVEPVVFVNSDEEIGSRTSRGTIERLSRRAERVFVMEPSLGPRGLLKTRRKGVGRFEVTVRGKASHAGLEPAAGSSAILELSHVIQQLFELNDPDQGVTVNVGFVDGGIRPNVIAPVGRALVDVRVPDARHARDVSVRIHSLRPRTPGTEIKVTGAVSRPPMIRTSRNRALFEAARGVGAQLGLDLGEGTAGGASDGSYTSLHAATLDGLGPVGGGAHAADEFVRVSSLHERAALLACLLLLPGTADDHSAVGGGANLP